MYSKNLPCFQHNAMSAPLFHDLMLCNDPIIPTLAYDLSLVSFRDGDSKKRLDCLVVPLPLELRGRSRVSQPHLFIEKQGESPMNWDRVEGNWREFKGKVQQKWGKLTNDDLDVVKGKRGELAGRLQQRYGYAKDQAEREIDMCLRDAA